MAESKEKNPGKGVAVNGQKVAELRRAKFFSQEKLSRAAGMSRENLRRIEGEEVTGVHSDNFVALATALSMSPDDLLGRVGVKGHPPAALPAIFKLTENLTLEELAELAKKLNAQVAARHTKGARTPKRTAAHRPGRSET